MSEDYDLLEEISSELITMEAELRDFYNDTTNADLRALLDIAADAVEAARKEAERLND